MLAGGLWSKRHALNADAGDSPFKSCISQAGSYWPLSVQSQRNPRGNGGWGPAGNIYIYNFFPPSCLLTLPPARLAIVWDSAWDTSCRIRRIASCYILSKNWFFTVAFFFFPCWKCFCFCGRSGQKDSSRLQNTCIQSQTVQKILLWLLSQLRWLGKAATANEVQLLWEQRMLGCIFLHLECSNIPQ